MLSILAGVAFSVSAAAAAADTETVAEINLALIETGQTPTIKSTLDKDESRICAPVSYSNNLRPDLQRIAPLGSTTLCWKSQ